ncbi:Cu-oxidase [Cryptococcus neoformans Tu259-1]|uniref:Cu-oxidase n=1 Tax=Cryptococcus neoformans Tu259-1 TaxID=1230072 RepID=A0A854QAE4_CRYNE|nr:Cu-oxidase [Cryptococcus neoformans var. grubii AD1-7a]OXG16659.1 Cu-oxidase [Cryptococcus neoformans var. grubii Tu259-1]OXG35978.1 Cu-oxidase [Cryptococcus neoformans var. grubii Bt15]OXG38465.1 Cu-oxidase [Cryptococcus neoformans var. grubii Bt120]OXH28674.1 Cu-oxidase [Cryptococcus neoformans var. grubii]
MGGIIKLSFLFCSLISLVNSENTGKLPTAISDHSVPKATATTDPSVFVLSNDFEITDVPTTREYTFNLTEALASPDGYERLVYAVNNMLPGPVIEANTGDTVIVHVNNYLHEGQGIHWHGLRQNGTALMDGVPGITQCSIPPGGSFTYQFTVSHQSGTFWWHSHYSNSMADGIWGPLIIHSPNEPLQRGRDYDEDRIVAVTDWMHDESETIVEALISSEGYRGRPFPPQGDAILINGRGQTNCTATGSPSCTYPPPPEIHVPVNCRVRLRFISAASHPMYRISIDNHSMEIVETDGTAVYGPTIHEISISSGERYSVIINTTEGKEGDAFWLRTSVALDCMAQGVTQVGLAVVRYTGNGSITTAEPRTEAWTDLARPDTPCVGLDEMYHLSPRELVNASQTALESRVLDSKLGKFVDVYGNSFEGYGFNNVTYQNQINDPLLYVVQRGGTCNSSLIANATFADIGPVNIIINNLDSHIGHPYHMHGTEFQLMGRGTGALTLDDLPNTNLTLDNPTRKDTIWMQGGSWALLRIISDNPGVWALHCHIGWHLAKGKMAVVVVQPEAIKKIQWPESWMDLCANTDPNAFGPARRSVP